MVMDCPVNQSCHRKVDSRWRRLRDWFDLRVIAPRCLVCDEPGWAGRDLCQACQQALCWNRCACRRCGLPLPAPAEACGECLRRPPAFLQTETPLVYGFPVDHLLPRFKFHGDLAAGRALAELFLAALPARPAGDWPQALVPVPLHPDRLRQRGYDQALELAKALATGLGLPLCADGLRRCRSTGAQTERGAAARRRNVRGAFAPGRGALPARVALVDDVITTGATATECARVLRSAGVATVELWAMARAPKRG